MAIQRFTGGPDSVREKLNQIVDAVNAMARIVGDGLVTVRHAGNRMTIGLSVDRLASRLPKFQLNTFYAKLTGENAGSYAWTEYELDAAGDWAAVSDGRSGATDTDPAKEFSGAEGLYDAGEDRYVVMYAITDAGGGTLYRFPGVTAAGQNAGAAVTIDAAAAAGNLARFAREDHGHEVDTAGNQPLSIDVDGVNAAGMAGAIARASHVHKVVTSTNSAEDIVEDGGESAGTQATICRAGHKHALPLASESGLGWDDGLKVSNKVPPGDAANDLLFWNGTAWDIVDPPDTTYKVLQRKADGSLGWDWVRSHA